MPIGHMLSARSSMQIGKGNTVFIHGQLTRVFLALTSLPSLY